MDSDFLKALGGSALDFFKTSGKSFGERYKPLNEYITLLEKHKVFFTANRVITSLVASNVDAEISGSSKRNFLNFSSQDYLGLAQSEEVKNAAHEAIDNYGVHTSSSPVLSGRNILTEKLENKLADITGTEQSLLFPVGWGACFGAIAALVNHSDHILLDALSHNSLQVASSYSTDNIHKFRHNDVGHLDQLLIRLREKEPKSGIFVVIEGLYSMNSDMPDLKSVLELTKKYEAILIVDIAHDFGAMGKKGLGILETIEGEDLSNLVLVGAFSKSFATNGGFVAGPACIRKQLSIFGPTYTFSNGISPVQCAIALKCSDIIFSSKGDELRLKLNDNIQCARREFNSRGFETNGIPSPIVPVNIGNEDLARIIGRENIRNGLMTNIAEFPAVPKGKAIFRFQLMSTHEHTQIIEAAEIISQGRKEAQLILQ